MGLHLGASLRCLVRWPGKSCTQGICLNFIAQIWFTIGMRTNMLYGVRRYIRQPQRSISRRTIRLPTYQEVMLLNHLI
jgi:hypothetical protein